MLKSLEITGFKSFAVKTILEFPEKITAIVGPNGAGKSNIVDAVRWVLGEQSLKNLRSARAEDVIFSGTASRPATSLASVVVTLDNSKHIFPVEYEELAIGRRVLRDGTSEYLLNKSATRLKEITHLLASARLGVRGLAIINQGAGDVFLRASGVERRDMLEEALGLKEFRLKKEETERKLRETKVNMEQVASLLSEIEPHLRSLKRQASRWEKRQEKEASLKVLEEEYFFSKLSDLEGFEADFGAESKKIEKELLDIRKAISEAEHAFDRLQEETVGSGQLQEKLTNEIRLLENKRAEVLRAVGKIEGQIESLGVVELQRDVPQAVLIGKLQEMKSRLENLLLADTLERIKTEINNLLLDLKKILSGSFEEPTPSETLGEEKDKLLRDLGELEKELKQKENKLDAILKAQESTRSHIRNLFADLESKRRQLLGKEKLISEYQFEEEKKKLKESELRAKMMEAGLDFDEFTKSHRGQAHQALAESFEEREAKIFRLRRELADIGAIDEEILREYQETSKRQEMVLRENQDLENAFGDLTQLAADLEKRIQHDFAHSLKTISDAFSHYVGLIFSGGSARLREETALQVEANANNNSVQALPPGIEISVSLPRKKIKNIDMLSGGERALTSIALLFAIVGSSAPPFIILDEVDAALDETNSQRFAELLRELSAKTQFILITHNRATMEVADILYGVTIEDGISKIFSLKFEEAEKVAAQDVHPTLD